MLLPALSSCYLNRLPACRRTPRRSFAAPSPLFIHSSKLSPPNAHLCTFKALRSVSTSTITYVLALKLPLLRYFVLSACYCSVERAPTSSFPCSLSTITHNQGEYASTQYTTSIHRMSALNSAELQSSLSNATTTYCPHTRIRKRRLHTLSTQANTSYQTASFFIGAPCIHKAAPGFSTTCQKRLQNTFLAPLLKFSTYPTSPFGDRPIQRHSNRRTDPPSITALQPTETLDVASRPCQQRNDAGTGIEVCHLSQPVAGANDKKGHR